MKAIIRKFMAASMLLAALLVFAGVNAQEAHAGFIKDLKQTARTTSSMTVAWGWYGDNKETIQNYQIDIREYSGSGEYRTVASNVPAGTTQYTINGLKAGTKYYIKVTTNYRYASGSYSSDRTTSSTIYNAATAVTTVSGLKQTKWWYFALALDVAWNKQDAADGYEVEARTSNGKLFKKAALNGYSQSTSFSGIKNDMIYTVRIRPYQTIDGVKKYAAWSAPIYCFTQPRITAIKIKGGKMTVKWKKVSGATGYRIYVSTKPTSGYKKVKQVSGKKGSVKISKFKKKKFKAKKTYYVYIQTLKKVNGKVNTSGRLYYWNSKKSTNSFGYFN